jgi:hypothetical protein
MGDDQMSTTTRTLGLALLAGLAMPLASIAAMTPGQVCEKTASDTLRTCVKMGGKLHQKCYQTTGGACLATDPKLVEGLARVSTKILPKCPDQATVQAAGYGAVLTPTGLVDRMENACTSAVASLAARSYGGPHAAVRATASVADQKCLDRAWRSGQSLIIYNLKQQSICIRNVAAGKTCDPVALAAKLTTRETTTVTRISDHCPNALSTLVAVDPTVFAARAAAQARCLVATAHGQTAPLTLDCGPRASIPVPARGVDTQIVLPYAIFGSRCGDGSDYAFHLRLAPTGSPVEKIVVHMAGGGACLDGPGCAGTDPDLFEAMSDNLPNGGMMSSTSATNPFRDWTKVSLPYCTQDVHIGGGVPTAYTEITVQRYGALNVRATMQYVRDVIWAELNATDPDGYRADRPLMVFSGTSAGGYGAAYNYHWVLDDLGWVHTTAAPDASLAMDNGIGVIAGTAGVIAFGSVMLSPTFPGWNAQPFLPPYCYTDACFEIFGNLELATAPRLLGVPEQQFLMISNQVDDVQRNTTQFASTPAFINTLRTNYCSLQGTPGLHSFLRASTPAIHGEVNDNNWNDAIVGGTVLRDWLGDAMSNPAGVIDKTADGTLQADFAGVLPFPCTIGSPSGAFVDAAD